MLPVDDAVIIYKLMHTDIIYQSAKTLKVVNKLNNANTDTSQCSGLYTE